MWSSGKSEWEKSLVGEKFLIPIYLLPHRADIGTEQKWINVCLVHIK